MEGRSFFSLHLSQMTKAFLGLTFKIQFFLTSRWSSPPGQLFPVPPLLSGAPCRLARCASLFCEASFTPTLFLQILFWFPNATLSVGFLLNLNSKRHQR